MKKKFVITFIIAIFVLVGIIALSLLFVNFYKVTEISMQPNYNKNDFLIIKKTNAINRNDIVVFYSQDEELIIRRVIGIAGDYIEIKDGKVFITPKKSGETQELNEKYLSKDTKTCLTASNSCVSTLDFAGKKYFVDENMYFILADNRANSQDSRHWRKNNVESPFISTEDILGKVIFKIWPLF